MLSPSLKHRDRIFISGSPEQRLGQKSILPKQKKETATKHYTLKHAQFRVSLVTQKKQ